MNILLIEDNKGDFIIINELLKSSGLNFNLSWTQNLNTGIDAIKTQPFDVVLADMGLPDSKGFGTIQNLLETGINCPIVVITGNTDESIGMEAINHGAQDYIVKGEVSPQHLARILQFAVKRKEAELILKNHKEILELEVKNRTRDLEQLKENLEITVAQRTAELSEANAMKDRFFSIIAHDLKSPFNAILGFLDLLKDDYDSLSEQERKRYVNILSETSQNTFNLLENLLEWARTQRGHIQYSPVKLDVSEITEEVFKTLRTSALKKDIQLINQNPGPTLVFADQYMVHTIMRNLVSNAIKFSYPKSVINVVAEIKDGNTVISVEDAGTGMTQEDVANVFRIDMKISRNGTAKERGTGLGLILCKDFVSKNKGEIWIESSPGKGSRISFSLPTFLQEN